MLRENKDIVLLSLCWAWTFSLATLLTFVGPLSSKSVNSSEFYATFTVGIFVIGTAISNIPSTYLFTNYGRKGGFIASTICLIIGSIVGCLSLYGKILEVLWIGSLILGIGVGLGQFYRFAAIDIAGEDNKSWAVTTVLTGGCFAAFFGPTLGLLSRHMVDQDYLGCYFMMILLSVVNLITVLLVSFEGIHGSENKKETRDLSVASKEVVARPLRDIVLLNEFTVPTAINTVAQTFMIIIMVNCGLELSNRGFTFVDQSLVLDLHFFSMFGTGFITNYCIQHYSMMGVIGVGTTLFGVALVIFLVGDHLWNFFLGDILIGVAWNMLFSSGTVMLSSCYSAAEMHGVQAANEFIINSVSGIFSIVSGFILSRMGWDWMLYSVLICYIILSLLAAAMYRAWGCFAAMGSVSSPRRTSKSASEDSGVGLIERGTAANPLLR